MKKIVLPLFIQFLVLFLMIGCKENIPLSPIFEITYPKDGQQFEIGDTVIISVEANDHKQNVFKVNFYINQFLMHSDSTPPYNYKWDTSLPSNFAYPFGRRQIIIKVDNKSAVVTNNYLSVSLWPKVYDQAIVFNPELNYDTVTDIDGNTYKTIKIGEQEWMAQNLATTHFNDGKPIPLVTDNDDWSNLSSSAYCWYYNDDDKYQQYYNITSFKEVYGALYTWRTVETGKLCPSGWHVSTDGEWKQLERYLGMDSISIDRTGGRGNVGVKLKETGNSHWKEDMDIDATNESGFTALPGDKRGSDGTFYEIGFEGYWWTSTIINEGYPAYIGPCYRALGIYNSNMVHRRTSSSRNGYSVRCIKNK